MIVVTGQLKYAEMNAAVITTSVSYVYPLKMISHHQA
jgi:hypothetical protein